MDPLSTLASAIAIYQLATKLGGILFGYAQGVRKADSEVHSTIDEINKFESSLRTLSTLLQDERLHGEPGEDRLQNLREALSEDQLELKTCREELEKVLRKLEAKRQHSDHKQARALLDKLKWPLMQDDVQRLHNSMRQLSKQIDRAQNIDSLSITRAIDTRTRQMDVTLKGVDARTRETNAGLKEIEERLQVSDDTRTRKEKQKENEAKIKKLTEWLAPMDTFQNYNIATEARNENANTGLWFLKGDGYLQLKKSISAILWLYGDPGSGKTVLTATAIDDLKAFIEANHRAALAFWYFSSNDKGKTSFDECLKALLDQCVRAFKNKIPTSILALDASIDKNIPPRRNDLMKTITRLIVEENMDFYFVLDALDESRAEDLSDLLNFLNSLLHIHGSVVRVLVTSRTPVKEEFQERFPNAANASFIDVPLSREHVEVDIKSHIEDRLANDPNLNRWPPELRDLISDKLTSGAQGMFRWVDCQLKDLRKCKTQKTVKKTLDSLPENLQEQYRRDLQNVGTEYEAKIVLSILRWLAFPQRKLTLREAAEIVAVVFDEKGKAKFDEEERLGDTKFIFELCGSLVRVEQTEEGVNHLGEKEGVQSLTASHQTVLDFLTSGDVQVGALKPERFSRANVNYKMALSCLTYLNWLFTKFPDLDESYLDANPCARLSAQYFDDYIRELIADPQEILDIEVLNDLIIKIMDDKSKLLKLIQLCNHFHEGRVDFSLTADELHDPLYYASLLGLPAIVEHYLGTNVEHKNYSSPRDYGTPLVAACAKGRQRCVEILLASGADPTLASNKWWGTPLAVAIEKDHAEIVAILLAQPTVDVNSVRYDSSLLQAIELRESSQSSDRGAFDLDFMSLEPMIYIAALYNSSGALDTLLERKADVNLTGGRLHTALIAACSESDESIVNKLLDHGASPAIYGGDYDNALVAACYKGRPFGLDTYTRLIDGGADVNRKGGSARSRTPLYFAACNLDPTVVKLLINKGAEVNIRGCGDYDNPLQGASRYGNSENVRVLLRHGADITFQGQGDHDNCLTAAAVNGHAEVVKLLLDAGVSPNIKGGVTWFPLIAACYDCDEVGNKSVDVLKNKLAVVKLLLDYGADVNATIGEGDNEGMRPLYRTSLRTDSIAIEVIRLLVNRGAKFYPRGAKNHQSPLLQAIVSGNTEVVECLFSRVSDEQIPSGRHYFYLGYAISHNAKLSVIKTLIRADEIDVTDEYYQGTALHIAAMEGNFRAVNLLLKTGANPDIIHWSIGSVLHASLRCNEPDKMFDKLYGRVTNRNATNAAGQNVLLFAVLTRCTTTAKRLLSMGYKMDYMDKAGRNGLHYAAANSTLELLQIAIESGIDVNSKDYAGRTPLHYAAISDNNNSLAFISALLEAGADASIVDEDDRTPANIAYNFNKAKEFYLLRGKAVHAIPNYLLLECSVTPEVEEIVTCIGCGGRREYELTWNCQTCDVNREYRCLCFLCFAYHERIHPQDHTWEPTKPELVLRPLPTARSYPELDHTTPGTLLWEHLDEHQKFEVKNSIYKLGNNVPFSNESNIQNLRGNTAFPSRKAYFEVTLIDCAEVHYVPTSDIIVGIGLAAEFDAKAGDGMVGWSSQSWGYHSDDGLFYVSGRNNTIIDSPRKSTTYSNPFGIGDTVGAGIDRFVSEYDDEMLALFFTKNGKHLGAFLICIQDSLFPMVSVKSKRVVLDVNFGEREFIWKGEGYEAPEPENVDSEGTSGRDSQRNEEDSELS